MTKTRTRTRRVKEEVKGEERRASTTLRPRRTPPLPQPTPPSGALQPRAPARAVAGW